MILIVVPARGGSTRLPRKNLLPFRGLSLASTAAWQARRVAARLAPQFAIAVVSTDDEEIANDIWAHTDVPVLVRGKFGDGPMADVLTEALARVAPDAEFVVTLQPTSPLRTDFDILACIARAVGDEYNESVVSVNPDRERNGAVYVTPVDMLWGEHPNVFDAESIMYTMPHERSVDINTRADYERMLKNK